MNVDINDFMSHGFDVGVSYRMRLIWLDHDQLMDVVWMDRWMNDG